MPIRLLGLKPSQVRGLFLTGSQQVLASSYYLAAELGVRCPRKASINSDLGQTQFSWGWENRGSS